MTRRAGGLVGAVAAALLLLGLFGAPHAAHGSTAPTATATGHDAVVVASVGVPRLSVADPGSRVAAPAAGAAAQWVPTPSGARDTTEGSARTPAPHLLASTGDRAPPTAP